ncbi:hypothetical protein Tco_0720951, partial [Tanacetum coccineum]
MCTLAGQASKLSSYQIAYLSEPQNNKIIAFCIMDKENAVKQHAKVTKDAVSWKQKRDSAERESTYTPFVPQVICSSDK